MNVIVSWGRFPGVGLLRLSKRLVVLVLVPGYSLFSSQPKLVAGASSQAWTSAAICALVQV